MKFPGFIGPSYTLQSVNVDCQRTINLYPEINETGTGKESEVASLRATPGLSLLVTLPESPVRGVYTASDGTLYAVGGSKLYKLTSAWVATQIGSLDTLTGPVSMSDNGIQLVVVDGLYGYGWTIASSTFAKITDPDFLPADQVTYQDGYFIFNRTGTGQFAYSDLNSLDFSALDFATAEGTPDNLVGLISDHQNLYLFGTQSTEVFYDSGDANTPFVRTQGAIVEVGCAAAFSIQKVQNAIYWLGQDETGRGIVYRAQGYQPTRISTHAIEAVIAGLADVSDARAWSYQQAGHSFYCLNLPGASSTWVFDTSTSLWHERAYLNLGVYERHRADCHTFAYETNVVGDYATGALYALTPSALSDNGATILRERAAPHISKDLTRMFHTSFQLDMETGVGTSDTGQGNDPKVILQWSDDGGSTWSNEHWADIGKLGVRTGRAIWRRLGSSRDRVYRIRISDPVRVTLISAQLGIEGGTS